MPHMLAIMQVLGATFLAAPGDPAFDVVLGNAGQGQGAGGNVLRDRRTGADVGAVSHGDGRDELAVAADEGVFPDCGPMLLLAVVVTGTITCNYDGEKKHRTT